MEDNKIVENAAATDETVYADIAASMETTANADVAASTEATANADAAASTETAANADAAANAVATATVMIDVRALTKRFDGYAALDNMALHVPKGSVYGLVGPNGAGKTTLIRHIAGVYSPDSGETLIDGEPVWENPYIKERIIHIPDDLSFAPYATISDLAAYYRNIYPRFDTERFERLKPVFPLDCEKRVSRFSKGMQKQAALWIALCCTPDVMLLDEPVDGLDPIARRVIWGLILRDVAERRTTVLISSHNLRELDGISDHIGIMMNGRLVLERALADLQGETTKLQVLLKQNADFMLPGFSVLHESRNGSLAEYIVKGGVDSVLAAVNALDPPPLFVEALPLTLEEIFIYELGGMGYAADII